MQQAGCTPRVKQMNAPDRMHPTHKAAGRMHPTRKADECIRQDAPHAQGSTDAADRMHPTRKAARMQQTRCPLPDRPRPPHAQCGPPKYAATTMFKLQIRPGPDPRTAVKLHPSKTTRATPTSDLGEGRVRDGPRSDCPSSSPANRHKRPRVVCAPHARHFRYKDPLPARDTRCAGPPRPTHPHLPSARRKRRTPKYPPPPSSTYRAYHTALGSSTSHRACTGRTSWARMSTLPEHMQHAQHTHTQHTVSG